MTPTTPPNDRPQAGEGQDVQKIMGVPFWNRSCEELLGRIHATGGLLVVPSAPSFCSALEDAYLLRCHTEADYAVMDSGYLSLLLGIAARHKRPPRISGYQVIEKLLNGVHTPTIAKDKILWVVPGEETDRAIQTHLEKEGYDLTRMSFYRAPQYGQDFRDDALFRLVAEFDPKWVIICISGGRQEKLGFELRNALPRPPAILCTGAAVFFFSGAQARIPKWVDRTYLGWLWRIASDPARFGPRYWNALRLPLVLLSGSRKGG